MNQQIDVCDERDIGAFIPAALDDYGLDTYEFRVYARLVRRAGKTTAYESIANIAKACKIGEQKVKEVLRFLCLAQMVGRDARPGAPSVYKLKTRSAWVHPELLDDLRLQAKYHSGVGTTQVLRTPRCRNNPGVEDTQGVGVEDTQGVGVEDTQGVGVEDTHKGTPIKVLPLRETIKDLSCCVFDKKTKKDRSRDRREKLFSKRSEQVYASLKYLDKFNKAWNWYRSKLENVPPDREGRKPSPGGKVEAAIAWRDCLESGDRLEDFKTGLMAYDFTQVGIPHFCRFISKGYWDLGTDDGDESFIPSSGAAQQERDCLWLEEARQKHRYFYEINGQIDQERRAFYIEHREEILHV